MNRAARQVPDRPLWEKVALSAALTAALACFGASWGYVGSRIASTRYGPWVFVILVFLITVPVLVTYAYTDAERRWYHFAIFEALVLGAFTLVVPLVYLPWRIVERHRWR